MLPVTYFKIGYIMGAKTYINDILVLGKRGFYQYIDQLRVIFDMLCAAGHKVDAPKCSFVVNYIT